MMSLLGAPKRPVVFLLKMFMLFVSIQITVDTSTRPTPSFTHCETITGMDTLKKM